MGQAWSVSEDPSVSDRATPLRAGLGHLRIACGLAPETVRFVQGSICPSCGRPNMTPVPESFGFACPGCSHTITLPRNRYPREDNAHRAVAIAECERDDDQVVSQLPVGLLPYSMTTHEHR